MMEANSPAERLLRCLHGRFYFLSSLACCLFALSCLVTIGARMVDVSTVISAAQSQIGKPYVWATPSNPDDPNPKSFDCSGLTMWCYKRAGVQLTHFTGTQYTQLSHRSVNSAQPGDLVFYAPGRIGVPYHVAINVGDGQLIEAPEVGIPVRLRNWTPGDSDVMGNVGYSTTVTSAVATGPYGDGMSLKTPLTKSQRSTIISYLNANGGSMGQWAGASSTDAELIQLYRSYEGEMLHGTGGILGAASGIAGIGGNAASAALTPLSLLEQLFQPQLWIRVAEFVVGGALLFIAAHAIVKETTGISPAKSVSSVAGKAALL